MEHSHRKSIVELATKERFELNLVDSLNPTIGTRRFIPAEYDIKSNRGWRNVGSSTFRLCYCPPAPVLHHKRQGVTIGTKMVAKGLGWEHHDIEYVPLPDGYREWCINILQGHSSYLKGHPDDMDFIYGAVYCSVGNYSINPSILKSLLERWSSKTNTFIFHFGECTVTLLDMHRMVGLPLDGDFYEEYVPPTHELDPALLQYPNFLKELIDSWDKLAVDGEVKFQDWCDHFYNKRAGNTSYSDVRERHLFVAAFLALWLCGFVVVGGGPHIRWGY